MVSRERDACTWITSEVWEGEGSIYKLGLWGGGGGEAEIGFFSLPLSYTVCSISLARLVNVSYNS